MIEHIKTTVLSFLILLSIFLTYQIWTFQPEYAILKSTEYIENTPIAEEKRLLEVIKPKQMIIHDEGNAFLPVDNLLYLEKFYETYRGVSLEKVSLSGSLSGHYEDNTLQGIELIFPVSIPHEVLKEMFQINNSEPFIIEELDRMLFYLDQEGHSEQVYGKLISTSEQVSVTVSTNISVSKFKEEVEAAKLDDVYEAFPYEIINYGNGFKSTVYLPKEPLYVNSVTYLAKPISPEHFKHTLFSDPNFVKHYLQANGEESFTDGNRMVNVLNGGNILRYINPTFGDVVVDRNSKHMLFMALDFLNGHGGLTNAFYFDSMKSFGPNEEIIFRLSIDGMPVYYSNYGNNPLFEITLNRTGANQIDEYVRPLFFVENDPVNITKTIELASGYDLIEALAEKEDFNRFLLTDINKGFVMIKRQSFVIFEPRWFIRYNGNWEIVNVVTGADDSEGFLNGLE